MGFVQSHELKLLTPEMCMKPKLTSGSIQHHSSSIFFGAEVIMFYVEAPENPKFGGAPSMFFRRRGSVRSHFKNESVSQTNHCQTRQRCRLPLVGDHCPHHCSVDAVALTCGILRLVSSLRFQHVLWVGLKFDA